MSDDDRIIALVASPTQEQIAMRGSDCKVSRRGGATATNDRGKKEKRGEDDDKCQWCEEGCNGVAMDAINNQLGVAERQ